MSDDGGGGGGVGGGERAATLLTAAPGMLRDKLARILAARAAGLANLRSERAAAWSACLPTAPSAAGSAASRPPALALRASASTSSSSGAAPPLPPTTTAANVLVGAGSGDGVPPGLPLVAVPLARADSTGGGGGGGAMSGLGMKDAAGAVDEVDARRRSVVTKAAMRCLAGALPQRVRSAMQARDRGLNASQLGAPVSLAVGVADAEPLTGGAAKLHSILPAQLVVRGSAMAGRRAVAVPVSSMGHVATVPDGAFLRLLAAPNSGLAQAPPLTSRAPSMLSAPDGDACARLADMALRVPRGSHSAADADAGAAAVRSAAVGDLSMDQRTALALVVGSFESTLRAPLGLVPRASLAAAAGAGAALAAAGTSAPDAPGSGDDDASAAAAQVPAAAAPLPPAVAAAADAAQAASSRAAVMRLPTVVDPLRKLLVVAGAAPATLVAPRAPPLGRVSSRTGAGVGTAAASRARHKRQGGGGGGGSSSGAGRGSGAARLGSKAAGRGGQVRTNAELAADMANYVREHGGSLVGLPLPPAARAAADAAAAAAAALPFVTPAVLAELDGDSDGSVDVAAAGASVVDSLPLPLPLAAGAVAAGGLEWEALIDALVPTLPAAPGVSSVAPTPTAPAVSTLPFIPRERVASFDAAELAPLRPSRVDGDAAAVATVADAAAQP